jgi:hypothetical protein
MGIDRAVAAPAAYVERAADERNARWARRADGARHNLDAIVPSGVMRLTNALDPNS